MSCVTARINRRPQHRLHLGRDFAPLKHPKELEHKPRGFLFVRQTKRKNPSSDLRHVVAPNYLERAEGIEPPFATWKLPFCH